MPTGWPTWWVELWVVKGHYDPWLREVLACTWKAKGYRVVGTRGILGLVKEGYPSQVHNANTYSLENKQEELVLHIVTELWHCWYSGDTVVQLTSLEWEMDGYKLLRKDKEGRAAMMWRSLDVESCSGGWQQFCWQLVHEDGRGQKGWYYVGWHPIRLRKRTKLPLKVSESQALIFMEDSNSLTSAGRMTLERKQSRSSLEDVGANFLIQVLDRSTGWYTAGSAVYYQQLLGDQMINGSLGYTDWNSRYQDPDVTEKGDSSRA